METTFAKLGACSRQYVVSRVTRSESIPVPDEEIVETQLLRYCAA